MEDHYIWSLVAFVEQLPSLTPMEYRALVASSDATSTAAAETDMHDHSGQHSSQTGDHHGASEQGETDAKVHRHSDGSRHQH